MTCAYCGKPARGNLSIHRDGFGVGPEVPLCNDCGLDESLSSGEIWDRIAQPSSNAWAYKPIDTDSDTDPRCDELRATQDA